MASDIQITPPLMFRRKTGFTFLEILLVVGIAAVLAALSVPMFMKSYRGAKLKASARTIASVHRYARSISVLQQKQVAVLFDTVKGTIRVVSLDAENGGFRGRMTDLPSMSSGGDEDVKYTVKKELLKELEDGVEFDDIDVVNSDQSVQGTYIINYYVNGMCDKYEVRLVDKRHRRKRIDVDNISGSVEIKDE